MHFPTWCLFFYFLGLIHPECRCRPPFTVPSLLCDSSHPSHHPPNINSLCHRLCRAFSHYHPSSSSFAHDCTPPVKGYPQAHEVCLTDGPLALQSALSARRAPPWTRHRARCLSGRRPPRITLQPPTARSLAKLHAATADTSLCGAAGHQQVCSSRASMGVSEANASIPAAVGDLEDSTPYKLFVGQARRRGPEYWPSPAALLRIFLAQDPGMVGSARANRRAWTSATATRPQPWSLRAPPPSAHPAPATVSAVLPLEQVPMNMTAEQLQPNFEPYGNIEEVTIIYDKNTHLSKGAFHATWTRARAAPARIPAPPKRSVGTELVGNPHSTSRWAHCCLSDAPRMQGVVLSLTRRRTLPARRSIISARNSSL